MRTIRRGEAILAGFLICAGATFAIGSVGDSVSNDGNSQATVTYTVTAPAGKTVKDVHWRPGNPTKQNLKAPTGSSAPGGWSVGAGTSDHQVATTQGSGLSGSTSGAFSFTFHTGGSFGKFEASLKRVKVTLTDNGSEEIVPGEGGNVIEEGGPITPGGGGGTGPNVEWPLSFVDWKQPGGGVVASIGQIVACRVETSYFGGQSFKVHAATALSQTANGADNPLGLDIDTSQEIPAAWGITITPTPGRSTLFTETEDHLDQAIVTIEIPDDLDLVGEIFYLVAASDSDGDGNFDLISRPLQVTIQNQGGGFSGLEVLEYQF